MPGVAQFGLLGYVPRRLRGLRDAVAQAAAAAAAATRACRPLSRSGSAQEVHLGVGNASHTTRCLLLLIGVIGADGGVF
eukprot:CAMPEP_0174732082 /NCGR_PEP_ID=MMETSP1094-20130205/58744_1 /TAXON_ID=156173 /ORGANISM="Chrysochromulina brevifilum, Strain UTEX LB 985" /LENGTH=78 /DNA_ID=CAMNT_0015934547 /DNA_START=215 /DNA_END=451 /DNA_ORIENTATION=-